MNAPAMSLMDDQNRMATYGDLVRNSINYFLHEYPNSVTVLSSFASLYHKLIQDLEDPPLEIVWFYGAVVFHSHRPSSLPPPEKLLIAEKMLEYVNESSCVYSVLKKVALVAPVIYLLYHLHGEVSATDPSLNKEIGIAIEGIVNRLSICCSQFSDEGGHGSEYLGDYLLDLTRTWMVDPVRDSDKITILASFFPSLGNEFHTEVTVCLGYLAGAVMNETLLLRLRLKIYPRIDKEDLHRNMLNVAIQTIKSFQNFYFLDMLLKMLSGPSLPIAAAMSYADSVLLRKVLYDAVILVDYSFYSGKWIQSSASQLRKLALAWVLAAERAIQFARAASDHSRDISYLNAFRECQLVAELIKWVCDQAGIVDRTSTPDITNPRVLIKWLLFLHDRGIEIFDHSMSVLHAKAVACISEVENEPPDLALYTGNSSANTIDLDEIREMGDQSKKGSLGPLCLTSAKMDAGRKRKETLSGFQEPLVKQVKLDHLGDAVGETFLSLSSSGGQHSGGLVKNGASDDDMDLMG